MHNLCLAVMVCLPLEILVNDRELSLQVARSLWSPRISSSHLGERLPWKPGSSRSPLHPPHSFQSPQTSLQQALVRNVVWITAG